MLSAGRPLPRDQHRPEWILGMGQDSLNSLDLEHQYLKTWMWQAVPVSLDTMFWAVVLVGSKALIVYTWQIDETPYSWSVVHVLLIERCVLAAVHSRNYMFWFLYGHLNVPKVDSKLLFQVKFISCCCIYPCTIKEIFICINLWCLENPHIHTRLMQMKITFIVHG